jgi:EAL and modified HD-GYP domain-containing signal transduction protein
VTDDGVPAAEIDDIAYIGRQPIFDQHRGTFAYQLLHRSSTGNAADPAAIRDGYGASRNVAERSLFEFGLVELLGGRPGFIHVNAAVLGGEWYRSLPADQIVLELMEDVDLDATTRSLAVEAKRLGYRVAVDRAVGTDMPLSPDILELADVVKVDVTGMSPEDLERTVLSLRALAPEALLLAERVEDLDQFRTCSAHGFDLFQGYFFARPEVLSRGKRSVNATAAVALLAEVQDPDVDLDRLERLASGDPTLAFRLLALVNSGAAGLAQRVDSIGQALILLGIEKVRQFATLITMTSDSRMHDELVVLGATRAGMARSLIGSRQLESAASTVGLLSVVDTIYRIPMVELVEEIPLAPMVVQALRDRTGPLGAMLAAIQLYEVGDVHALERVRPGELVRFIVAYREATAWADSIRSQLTRS